MKVREIKKEDIKVGLKVIHKGHHDPMNKDMVRKVIATENMNSSHAEAVTYDNGGWDWQENVMYYYYMMEEEPKTNDTKVMTYTGISTHGLTHGKNYIVKDAGEDIYELIGDDGNKRLDLKEFFADPSEYRNKLENHINKGTKHDQIGGSHYNINDPIQFAKDNFSKEELKGFYRINIIKYVARYDKKNGLEDLKKAKHYLDMLIELKEIEYAK